MNDSNRGYENLLPRILKGSCCKSSVRQIGIEIERSGMWTDGMPFHYRAQQTKDGTIRQGAEFLLTELAKKPGWEAANNPQGQPLGMSSPFGKVSLEPGSQLELSTDPFMDLFTLKDSVTTFENEVEKITRPWGLHWVGLGVNPLNKVEDIDLIPSHRYEIMTDYLGRRGKLGTSMMRLTSSVQINLDYANEEEAIEMLRAALAAAPFSYALFGNSPFHHGAESGYLSFRGAIWADTDPARVGLLPESFTSGFNFEKYSEVLWHRPLMFAQDRDKNYVLADGMTLTDIAQGKIPNVVPDEQNQNNAIRELFTEARLKAGYVEIRSIDGLMPEMRYAAAAFWMGFLYNSDARKFAIEKWGNVSPQVMTQLLHASWKDGLRARAGGVDLLSSAAQLVEHARQGLLMRKRGEEVFLKPVEQTLSLGKNPAEQILDLYRGKLKRNMAALIEYTGQGK